MIKIVLVILSLSSCPALAAENSLKPFSFSNCHEDLKKNNWIRTWTKKTKADCLEGKCPVIELKSFEFLPTNAGNKTVKVLNEDDDYRSSPLDFTALNCNLGAIQFSTTSSDGMDAGTVYTTMYDLVTGKAYHYSAQNFYASPDGKYFIIVKSRSSEEMVRLEDAGVSKPLPLAVELYDCSTRNNGDCKPKISKYEVSEMTKAGPTGVEGTSNRIESTSKDHFAIKYDIHNYLNCEISKTFEIVCQAAKGFSVKKLN
jgi:hypothetical protein